SVKLFCGCSTGTIDTLRFMKELNPGHSLFTLNARTLSLFAVASTLLAGAGNSAWAQLPTNFPPSTVVTNYPAAVADGYIFEGVSSAPAGVGYYAMILTNDGTPIWYNQLTNSCYDFKVLPNGYLHYAQQIKALSYTGGGDVMHQILDESFNPV